MGRADSQHYGRYGSSELQWAFSILSWVAKATLVIQGVCLTATSLVMALAQDNLDAFSTCYQKAVDRLRFVSIP